jgi:hypothetical protein
MDEWMNDCACLDVVVCTVVSKLVREVPLLHAHPHNANHSNPIHRHRVKAISQTSTTPSIYTL